MSKQINWKNKLRKAREKAKEPGKKSKSSDQVQFPWFMLLTSIPGDLIGWFNVLMILVTAGVWVTVSATIWNIAETAINALHFIWYSYLSSSGIKISKKSKTVKKLAVNKIATTLFGWIPVIGDVIPKLTISTFVYYFMSKAESKLPIKT